MQVHRFYLPPESCHEATLQLTGGEAHHAVRVLRLRPGDPVTVLDGVGHTYDCEVARTEKRAVQLIVRHKHFSARQPCQITLIQALPKPRALDYIVQKATELGAARIVPLLTTRAVSHLDEAAAREKPAKLLPVALEAVKQCGSPWLPVIEPPLPLDHFLNRPENPELAVVAALQSNTQHLKRVVADFHAQHHRQPATAAVWVGPEGDFTPEELEKILVSGAAPISLGPLVLRSDTAAIYCLSVLNHELQSDS